MNSIFCIFLLLPLITASGINHKAKPSNYYYGKRNPVAVNPPAECLCGPDSCEIEDTTTRKPTTTTTTTTREPTTTTTTTTREPTTTTTKRVIPAEPKCEQGWTLFRRTPKAENSFISDWCVKVIADHRTAIASQDAALICRKEGAELTGFENANEHSVLMELSKKALDGNMGSVTLDGRLIPECRNIATRVPKCKSKTESFVLENKNTDPSYMWKLWLTNNPDGMSTDGGVVEDCLTMFAVDSIGHDGFLNDLYCQYATSPNHNHQLFKSYGAVCGKKAFY